jgi:hypothetical protein
MESYAGMVEETLEDLAPEERYRNIQAAPAWRPLPPGLAFGDHGRLRGYSASSATGRMLPSLRELIATRVPSRPLARAGDQSDFAFEHKTTS